MPSSGYPGERLGLPPEGLVLYLSFGGGGDADLDAVLPVAVDALSGPGWPGPGPARLQVAEPPGALPEPSPLWGLVP